MEKQEKLPFDYMNAAGWVKNPKHMLEVSVVPYTTHTIAGSFTILERVGNQDGTNFVALADGTFGNVLGLPNGGEPFLRKHGREMSTIAHDHGKKAVLNGAWFKPEEAGTLASLAAELGFDVYECNRGCPNVFDGGKQKVIPSYHTETMEQADEHIARAVGTQIEVWEKLSPYLDPEDRVRESVRIIKCKRARLTVINTIPNFRPRDEKTGDLLITAKNTGGYCGMSGAGAKLLGIINAEHFVELLKPHGIGVNGTCGIRSGKDLEDYRRVECVGMQVGGLIYAADSARPLGDIALDWALSYSPAEAA